MCSLFYPGCPTRPIFEKNNMYDTAKIVEVFFNESMQQTDFSIIDMPLKKETYNSRFEIISIPSLITSS